MSSFKLCRSTVITAKYYEVRIIVASASHPFLFSASILQTLGKNNNNKNIYPSTLNWPEHTKERQSCSEVRCAVFFSVHHVPTCVHDERSTMTCRWLGWCGPPTHSTRSSVRVDLQVLATRRSERRSGNRTTGPCSLQPAKHVSGKREIGIVIKARTRLQGHL